MKIQKHPNGTLAKFQNKRAIVQSNGEDEFVIAFKKLKEESDDESKTSFVNTEGKVMTFGFRLSKEGAIALCTALLSELQEDESFTKLLENAV